jgi:hypothetical protein
MGMTAFTGRIVLINVAWAIAQAQQRAGSAVPSCPDHRS